MWTCALSGQALDGVKDRVVVTPSGQVCLARLLEEKLGETGGQDPFSNDDNSSRPLSMEGCIVVNPSATTSVVPPRPSASASSLPHLLSLVQSEYDALVLELFDTRKALQTTRRELSQALYQNDAAIRVVARMAQERDSYKEQLHQWQASTSANQQRATTVVEEEESPVGEPQAKKAKLAEADAVLLLTNDLPPQDMEVLLERRNALHGQRKPLLQQAAAQAQLFVLEDQEKPRKLDWHKTSCGGIVAMEATTTTTGLQLATTLGVDGSCIVYNQESQQIVYQVSTSTVLDGNKATHLSASLANESTLLVAVAHAESGHLAVLSVDVAQNDEATQPKAVTLAEYGLLVALEIHPSQQHVVATTQAGKIVVCRIADDGLTPVGVFQAEDTSVEYTTGKIHPDGLIYLAGTSTGSIHVWDWKSKTLAATLTNGDKKEPVLSMNVSPNGYHFATVHSDSVAIWDLRKQKVAAELPAEQASIVAFDASAKYVAHGNPTSITVYAVKAWDQPWGTVALPKATGKKAKAARTCSGLQWGPASIAATLDNVRSVYFYGSQKEEEK